MAPLSLGDHKLPPPAPIPPPPAGMMQAPNGAMTIKRKVYILFLSFDIALKCKNIDYKYHIEHVRSNRIIKFIE